MAGGAEPHGRRTSGPQPAWSLADTLSALLLALGLGAVLLGGNVLLAGLLGPLQLGPLARTVLLSLAEGLLLLPVWLIAIRRRRCGPSDLGLRRPRGGIAAGVGALLFILLLGQVYSALLHRFGLQVQPDVLPFFGTDPRGLLLALLAAGVAAPFAEEVFFRGFLYPGLKPRLGTRRASLTSAAVFALGHVLPTSWPPLFVIGLVLNHLYERTQSIWPGIFLHAALNSLALVSAFARQA